jgi:phthalate 4,5-cis-dihydrodiol dehydrogenase
MTQSTRTERTLKLGMVGIGVGGADTLPFLEAMPQIELVGGADINPVIRARFQERYPHAKVFGSVEEICRDPAVDAVLIATPPRFHAAHVITAAKHGKHVLVYRPMALSMSEAMQVAEAADQNKIKLVVAHTRGYTASVRTMRKIVDSGMIGRVRAIHMWDYSDWMLTSRSADDKDVGDGGGLPLKRAPDQVETVRVLNGGKLRSVRAMTGQWMPDRPMPGYYCAYLEFDDGTPCTIVHNGYGYFVGSELGRGQVPGGPKLEQRMNLRNALRAGTRDEEGEEQDKRLGGREEKRTQMLRGDWPPPVPSEAPSRLLVSCERGDMRYSDRGIYIYDDVGLHEVELLAAPERAVVQLQELYDVVIKGKTMFRDAWWEIATEEVCYAIMQSASERREVSLVHQMPIPNDYAADVTVSYLGG